MSCWSYLQMQKYAIYIIIWPSSKLNTHALHDCTGNKLLNGWDMSPRFQNIKRYDTCETSFGCEKYLLCKQHLVTNLVSDSLLKERLWKFERLNNSSFILQMEIWIHKQSKTPCSNQYTRRICCYRSATLRSGMTSSLWRLMLQRHDRDSWRKFKQSPWIPLDLAVLPNHSDFSANFSNHQNFRQVSPIIAVARAKRWATLTCTSPNLENGWNAWTTDKTNNHDRGCCIHICCKCWKSRGQLD